MSLRISNLATPKQRAMLKKLEYCGTGKYALERLTISDAADLLNELFEEQRLQERDNYEFDC